MAETMTTMDRIELLEGKVAGMLSRLPDPRLNTPDDFMREMLTQQLAKVSNRLTVLERRPHVDNYFTDEGLRKIMSVMSTRVGALEGIYPEQDEGIKVLQDQVDNLATAVRQLGGHVVEDDKLELLKDRLDNIVKGVEGFAQKQERMLTAANKHHAQTQDNRDLIHALQSWLNVTDHDLGLVNTARPFDELKKDWPAERHEKVHKLADESMEEMEVDIPDGVVLESARHPGILDAAADDLVEGRAELQRPVPQVYIRDATHGQHPHKVVVSLE